MSVVIIEYGMGNVGSIKNMLTKIGVCSDISNEITKIKSAKHIILPGVGAFDKAMSKLKKLKCYEYMIEKVVCDKTPLLGICLGMQLLTKSSEEGVLPGLGLIDAVTKKFKFQPLNKNNNLKIPHMGWNEIIQGSNHKIFEGFENTPKFYFVHSYHVLCTSKQNEIGITEHGYKFTSAIAKQNIIGVQFHPEKSHKYGITLLKNFTSLNKNEYH
jgi:glutamine amidotransferase